jgi:hypothetical protein
MVVVYASPFLFQNGRQFIPPFEGFWANPAPEMVKVLNENNLHVLTRFVRSGYDGKKFVNIWK